MHASDCMFTRTPTNSTAGNGKKWLKKRNDLKTRRDRLAPERDNEPTMTRGILNEMISIRRTQRQTNRISIYIRLQNYHRLRWPLRTNDIRNTMRRLRRRKKRNRFMDGKSTRNSRSMKQCSASITRHCLRTIFDRIVFTNKSTIDSNAIAPRTSW